MLSIRWRPAGGVLALLVALSVVSGPAAAGPVGGSASPLAPGEHRVSPSVSVWFTEPPATGGIDDALAAFIGSARKSLAVHIYQLSDPRIVEALVAAARRLGAANVRVVTEHDYLARGARDDDSAYARAYGALRAAGVRIASDGAGPDGGRGQSHHKFVVADGARVWTGSYNFTPQAATGQHNDGLVVRSRPLARAYLAQLDQEFSEGRFGKLKVPRRRSPVLLDGREVEAHFSPEDATRDEILREIRDADVSLYVAVYILTDPALTDALRASRRRGVDVRVVTDALGARSTWQLDPERPGDAMTLAEFLDGCGIGFRAGPTGSLMHHKFAVVDAGTQSNPTVITGSRNWTLSAERSNDENTLIFRSPELAELYRSRFLDLWGGKTPDVARVDSGVPGHRPPAVDAQDRPPPLSTGD